MGDQETEVIVEKLRKACLARGAVGIKSLGRTFRLFDDNRNRQLDLNEFRNGINDYQADLTEQEIQILFKEFDRDGSGTINFDEFLVRVRPPMSKTRCDLVKKAFAKFDRSGDGVVTVEDLKRVYTPDCHPKYKSGEWTAKQVFENFLNAYEPDPKLRDGRVTYEEFLNYYSGVSASCDRDIYFDHVMRSSWKI